MVLQTASREALQQHLADPAFQGQMATLMAQKQEAADRSKWFQEQHPDSPLNCVAYFSMEFMLSEALAIYVGGLGNVAGDQLKSASDLGVPVVAVGLSNQYHRKRQSSIDEELFDVVSGFEVLNADQAKQKRE